MKFAKFLRIPILKNILKGLLLFWFQLNSNIANGKLTALASNITQENGAQTSNVKLTKSYSAWLTWYKGNLSVEDYKKFISKRVG